MAVETNDVSGHLVLLDFREDDKLGFIHGRIFIDLKTVQRGIWYRTGQFVGSKPEYRVFDLSNPPHIPEVPIGELVPVEGLTTAEKEL